MPAALQGVFGRTTPRRSNRIARRAVAPRRRRAEPARKRAAPTPAPRTLRRWDACVDRDPPGGRAASRPPPARCVLRSPAGSARRNCSCRKIGSSSLRGFLLLIAYRPSHVLGAVDVELAVEMIDLVLQALSQKAFAFDSYAFAVTIEPRHRRTIGANDIADELGHREAAFTQLDFFAEQLEFGINDDRRFVLVVVDVHDEEPLRDVHLRGCQTDARGGVHGREHIVDELLKERLSNLFGIHAPGDLAKRGMIPG